MRKKAILIAAAAVLGVMSPVSEASAADRPAFAAPWPCGVTWQTFHHATEVPNAIDANGSGISGTPVLAGATGTVISAKWNGGYGNEIVIDHGGGWTSRVAHLSAFSVGAGQSVAATTEVGKVGSTGNSTGPHLHFEQLENGVTRPIVVDGVAMHYDGVVRPHTSGNCGGSAGPAPDRVNQTNGDGYADIVAVDGNGQLFGYHNGSLVNPDRSPFSGETWRLPNSDWRDVRHMAAGDVNGDGYADLVAAKADGSLEIYNNGSLVNEGGLPYLSRTWRFEGQWNQVRHLAVADVTDDGFADIVAIDGDGTLIVYANGSLVNPGGAPFGGETWRFGDWNAVRNLVLTDVNHDGAADIVAVDGNGQLFGYHNGSRVNANHAPFSGETWRLTESDWRGITHLTAGEINGDGYGDLIATKPDGSLEVYNNGWLVNASGKPYAGRTWVYQGQWNTIRNLA